MPPLRTLHILDSLDRRGAETFAVQLIDRFSRDRVEPAICTLHPMGAGMILAPERTPVFSRTGPRSTAPPFLVTLRHVIRVMDHVRPALVQCHGGRPLLFALAARVFRPGAVYVYTKIGSIYPWLNGALRRRLYGFLFERIDAIVAVGEQVRREMEDAFDLRRPRLLSIPTGRDPAPYLELPASRRDDLREALHLDDGEICIMTIGSLSWEKNAQGLLQIFDGAARRDPRLHLVFVGDGPQRASLSEERARLGLEGRVTFLGLRDDIPDLLAAADVVALPSLTEGLPGALIEAGMAGRPAVAFRVGSVSDILQNGETGFVVDSGDAVTFATRLHQLAADGGLRERLGAAAAARCRQMFDIRRCVQQYEALFDILIAQRRRPPEAERWVDRMTSQAADPDR